MTTIRKTLTCVAAGLLATTLALGVAPAAHAQERASEAPTCTFACWQYYGCYASYAAACQAANYLNRCGYCTKIVRSTCGCYYYVYYYA
jgi:hypothetical protein